MVPSWQSRVGFAALLLTMAPTSLAGIAVSSGPPPTTMDVTSSMFVDWHRTLDDANLVDDPENVVDLRSRLNLRFRRGDLTFGARLDLALFANGPSEQYQDDVRPEELFLKARLGRWSMTLGDDYVSMGRGIALNLRKVDELGFDVNLRGIHALWRGKMVSTRIHAGFTNVSNVDSVDEKLIPDPHDLITAGRIELRPTKTTRLGVHAVDVERRHSPLLDGLLDQTVTTDRFIRSWVAGGNLGGRFFGDALDLFAEFDVVRHQSEREGKDGFKEIEAGSEGLAAYGSATLFAGPATVLAEWKHYDNFSLDSTEHPDTAQQTAITKTFPYIAPPTLERIDQRIQQFSDVDGYHLRVDFALPQSKSRLFASGAWFQDAPSEKDTTLHAYAGWEFKHTKGHRTLLQAGYRLEEAPEDELVRLRMAHIDLDAYLLVAAGHDLQLHWNHEFRDKNPDQGEVSDNYLEGTSYLTWNMPPHWSLTAQVEYLTDNGTEEPIFPGAYIQYRFTQATFVRLFAGRAKGGLKCAGGICRIFPQFEGVKLEATVRL